MTATTSGDSVYKRIRGRLADGAPNPIDIHIGNRIKLRRQILHLSQPDLGRMLGLTYQQVQKYETGNNRISGSRLWDFACILGVDVNFFFTDMDAATLAQSPRYINNCPNQNIAPMPETPLFPTRSLEIIKALSYIKNREIAGNIYNLIISLSKSSGPLDKSSDNS